MQFLAFRENFFMLKNYSFCLSVKSGHVLLSVTGKFIGKTVIIHEKEKEIDVIRYDRIPIIKISKQTCKENILFCFPCV